MASNFVFWMYENYDLPKSWVREKVQNIWKNEVGVNTMEVQIHPGG